jgi:hypothetical protein
MKEATINAKQAGERGISAKSVKKVTEASTGCTHFLEYADLCSGTDVTRKIQGLNVWISTTKTTYVQVALERISKLSRLAWRVLARRIGTLGYGSNASSNRRNPEVDRGCRAAHWLVARECRKRRLTTS